jgi:hypothetical protein
MIEMIDLSIYLARLGRLTDVMELYLSFDYFLFFIVAVMLLQAASRL